MNVITDTNVLGSLFASLTTSAKELYWAVAWATSHSKIFPLMKKNRRKIRRLIVGTHFYQTDPTFIEEFYKEKAVRFILKPTGVFHPKVFLFIKPDATWDCIVGSANLSAPAFTENDECVVHFTSNDQYAEFCKVRVLDAIESYWKAGKFLSSKETATYAQRWKAKKKHLKALSERFGDRGRQPGKSTLEIPILCMTWNEYVARAKKEDRGKSIGPRLDVLKAIQSLFRRFKSLRRMNYEDREKIAGLTYCEGDNGEFCWFGSMGGAGRFRHVIKDNNAHVSRSLDLIPFSGMVTKDMFDGFIKELKRAFPDGGAGVAVASRLLAMKRPDVFVCLDSKNRRKLAEAFGISRSVEFEDYWNSIVERIRDSTWWQVPCPKRGLERRIWQGRAAMLDALFYEG